MTDIPDRSVMRRVAQLERLVERLEAMVRREPLPRGTQPIAGRLWRFSLNGAFTDGEADGDLLALDGTDTEKDVKIYDPRGVSPATGSGDEGECIEQLDVAGARRFYALPGGGGGNRVAYTEVVIPGRDGMVPGGPTEVQPLKLTTEPPLMFVNDGDPVEIYSWVKADSTDPADEEDGKLFIFIEEDEHGIVWFTGQDCPPGADEEEE